MITISAKFLKNSSYKRKEYDQTISYMTNFQQNNYDFCIDLQASTHVGGSSNIPRRFWLHWR